MEQLVKFLTKYKMTSADFGRLVGVSRRAVAMWLDGSRAVPATILAYIDLFEMCPSDVKLNRLVHSRNSET
jgi:DNA-binding transcriptional regulator YiaG